VCMQRREGLGDKVWQLVVVAKMNIGNAVGIGMRSFVSRKRHVITCIIKAT
jgi:hypothetical protein